MRTLTRKSIENVLVYCAVVIIVLLTTFPLLNLFLASFRTRGEIWAGPLSVFSLKFETDPLQNYKVVWLGQAIEAGRLVGFHKAPTFLPFLLNSAIVALSTTVLSVALGSLAGYSFSRFTVRGGKHLEFWFLSTQMFPPVVMAIPFVILMKTLQLMNTLPALILAHTTFCLPFAVWLLKGYFDELPTEMEEAALLDGCSRLGALRNIVLPLVVPGIAAVATFSMILSWNDLMFGLVLTSSNRTMPVAISTLHTNEGIRWDLIPAAGIVNLIPMLILAIFLQKHLVRGLTFGAFKK